MYMFTRCILLPFKSLGLVIYFINVACFFHGNHDNSVQDSLMNRKFKNKNKHNLFKIYIFHSIINIFTVTN